MSSDDPHGFVEAAEEALGIAVGQSTESQTVSVQLEAAKTYALLAVADALHRLADAGDGVPRAIRP